MIFVGLRPVRGDCHAIDWMLAAGGVLGLPGCREGGRGRKAGTLLPVSEVCTPVVLGSVAAPECRQQVREGSSRVPCLCVVMLCEVMPCGGGVPKARLAACRCG